MTLDPNHWNFQRMFGEQQQHCEDSPERCHCEQGQEMFDAYTVLMHEKLKNTDIEGENEKHNRTSFGSRLLHQLRSFSTNLNEMIP